MATVVLLEEVRRTKVKVVRDSTMTLVDYPDRVLVDQCSSTNEPLYDKWQRFRISHSDEWALETILDTMKDLRLNQSLWRGEPGEFYVLEQDLGLERGFAFLLPRIFNTRPNRTIHFYSKGMVAGVPMDRQRCARLLVKRLHLAIPL